MAGQFPSGAPPRRRGRWTLLTLVAALLMLGLGACSTADQGGGVASLSGEGQPTTTTTGKKDFEQARLEWAKCMREHGVDVPDPDEKGRITVERRAPSGGGKAAPRGFPDDPKFDEAQKACEHLMQGVEPPGGVNPEQMKERMLALSKCLRDKGYDVPDPEFNGRGGMLMRMAPKGVDPESKEFQDALRDCEKQAGLDEMRKNAPGNLTRNGP